MKYRAPRKPADLLAVLHSASAVSHVAVRSISASGIRVDGLAAMAVGGMVGVEVLGRTHEATVVWFRGKSVGLKFKTPLSAQELSAFHRPNAVQNRGTWSAKRPQSMHGFREMR